ICSVNGDGGLATLTVLSDGGEADTGAGLPDAAPTSLTLGGPGRGGAGEAGPPGGGAAAGIVPCPPLSTSPAATAGGGTRADCRAVFGCGSTGRLFEAGSAPVCDSRDGGLVVPAGGEPGLTRVDEGFEAPDGSVTGREADFGAAAVRPGATLV